MHTKTNCMIMKDVKFIMLKIIYIYNTNKNNIETTIKKNYKNTKKTIKKKYNKGRNNIEKQIKKL